MGLLFTFANIMYPSHIISPLQLKIVNDAKDTKKATHNRAALSHIILQYYFTFTCSDPTFNTYIWPFAVRGILMSELLARSFFTSMPFTL